MNRLGPYIIVQDRQPMEWCYFDLVDSAHSVCYQSPYPSTGEPVNWTEKQLVDKVPLYVYDPQIQQPTCFVINGGALHRVPFIELNDAIKTKVVHKVEQPRITHRGIVWDLTRQLASTYNVDKHYPETSNVIVHDIAPDLPDIISRPVPIQPTENKSINISEAIDMLQVQQCIRVEREDNCPQVMADGTIYVWEDQSTWHFRTGFLGEVIAGVFDDDCDNDVIKVLQQQDVGEMQDITDIRLKMSRSYLKLDYWQQAQVIGVLDIVWPLSSEFTVNEQIEACHAIIKSDKLIAEGENNDSAMSADINAFRPYLLPSSIDRLFKCNFYAKASDSYIFQGVDKASTIADIIVFIDRLLVASARALGDTQPITIKQPDAKCRIKCGEFDHGENLTQLISHGEFFEFILTWNADQFASLAEMSAENLIKLLTGLKGIIDPQTHHEYADISTTLMVAIAVQEEVTQDVAKEQLATICRGIISGMLNEVVRKGKRDIVQRLLEEDMDLNAKDSHGFTSLMIASHSGHADIVELLLEKGADPDIYSSDTTSLILASHAGHLKVVELLLKNGADINLMDSRGLTAFMWASVYKRIAVLGLFVENGLDLNAKALDGFTMLMNASFSGDLDLVRFLVEKGADLNVQNSHGTSALMLASEQGRMEIAQLLLENGADSQAKNSKGETAFMLASRKGYLKIVKLLLDNELLLASKAGDASRVKQLLVKGADVHAKSPDGRMVLEHIVDNILSGAGSKDFLKSINEELPSLIKTVDDYKITREFLTPDQRRLAMRVLVLQNSLDSITVLTTSQHASGFAAALISNNHERVKAQVDEIIEYAKSTNKPPADLINILSGFKVFWKNIIISALKLDPVLTIEDEVRRYVMPDLISNAVKITGIYKEHSQNFREPDENAALGPLL